MSGRWDALRERAEWVVQHHAPGDGKVLVPAEDVIDLLAELESVQDLNRRMLGIQKHIVRAPRYNEHGQRIMRDEPQA